MQLDRDLWLAESRERPQVYLGTGKVQLIHMPGSCKNLPNTKNHRFRSTRQNACAYSRDFTNETRQARYDLLPGIIRKIAVEKKVTSFRFAEWDCRIMAHNRDLKPSTAEKLQKHSKLSCMIPIHGNVPLTSIVVPYIT